MTLRDELAPGDVGYMIANMKDRPPRSRSATPSPTPHPAPKPLPGFKEIQPMVFAGIYPVSTDDFEQLKAAMGKLQINDSAFTYMAESSVALGFGFRCGFLGLLHMEIVQERLRREFNMDVISTYPGVVYEVTLTDGEEIIVDNPTFTARAAGGHGDPRADRQGVHHASPTTTSATSWQLVMENAAWSTTPRRSTTPA
jgi:GTP-binding protein LepA